MNGGTAIGTSERPIAVTGRAVSLFHLFAPVRIPKTMRRGTRPSVQVAVARSIYWDMGVGIVVQLFVAVLLVLEHRLLVLRGEAPFSMESLTALRQWIFDHPHTDAPSLPYALAGPALIAASEACRRMPRVFDGTAYDPGSWSTPEIVVQAFRFQAGRAAQMLIGAFAWLALRNTDPGKSDHVLAVVGLLAAVVVTTFNRATSRHDWASERLKLQYDELTVARLRKRLAIAQAGLGAHPFWTTDLRTSPRARAARLTLAWLASVVCASTLFLTPVIAIRSHLMPADFGPQLIAITILIYLLWVWSFFSDFLMLQDMMLFKAMGWLISASTVTGAAKAYLAAVPTHGWVNASPVLGWYIIALTVMVLWTHTPPANFIRKSTLCRAMRTEQRRLNRQRRRVAELKRRSEEKVDRTTARRAKQTARLENRRLARSDQRPAVSATTSGVTGQ